MSSISFKRIANTPGNGLTTSSLTAPVGSSGVIVGTVSTQTLTNKTISSSTNMVGANELRTTVPSVVIDGSSPPITGQMLRATGTNTGEWQDYENIITVAKSGGNFTTIQAAITAANELSPAIGNSKLIAARNTGSNMGDVLWVSFERLGNDVSDTYIGTLNLIQVTPFYVKWSEGAYN